MRVNQYQQEMMGRPSIKRDTCVFCGLPKQSDHHIVPRSQGGTAGPTVSVCGVGNESGCHGMLHMHRLHLRWNDGWECLYTPEPTKYDKALAMDGWRGIGGSDALR